MVLDVGADGFLQSIGADGKLGARRMTNASGTSISRPIVTSGGIAFTSCSGDKDARGTVIHVAGNEVRTAMLDLRRPATVVLEVTGATARVLQIRSERDHLAYRIIEPRLEPVAVPR